MSILFQYGDPGTCVKIYNPEEKDISKKLINTQPNYTKAANVLGLQSRTVFNRCRNKLKIYSPTLKMYVSVRLSSVSDVTKRKYVVNTTLKTEL